MNTTNNIIPSTKQERSSELYYFDKQKKIIYDKNNRFYESVFIKYCKYLDSNYVSKQSIYQEKRRMIIFLNYLEQENIDDIKNIDKNTIFNYIKSYPTYFRKNTIKNNNKFLRNILSFMYNNNYTDNNLSIFVPSIKIPKSSTIPSAWTDEEIQKIFNSITSEIANEKKLRLILLLAIKYGLRIGDIKNLKFENIDLKNMRINIILSKTKKEVSYPITVEVYSALVDYIKNERPKTHHKTIIVRYDGELYGNSNTFHSEITKLFDKSKIDYKNKKRGIHSMRHSLASKLLKENIPLPIISKVLEHSNKSTTTIYTKIDNNKLKQCCLSLDEVKIND